MGWASGERNIVSYANDVRIAGRYHEWVQDAVTVTVPVFRRIGLDTNLKNTKAVLCITRSIWGDWGETVYKIR